MERAFSHEVEAYEAISRPLCGIARVKYNDRPMKPIGSFKLTLHIQACLLNKSVPVVLSIQYA